MMFLFNKTRICNKHFYGRARPLISELQENIGKICRSYNNQLLKRNVKDTLIVTKKVFISSKFIYVFNSRRKTKLTLLLKTKKKKKVSPKEVLKARCDHNSLYCTNERAI